MTTTPTPVRIVRPKLKPRDALIELASAIVTLAVRAWILMLLAPLVGLTPGYWLTLGVVYGVRALLMPNATTYKSWTSAS